MSRALQKQVEKVAKGKARAEGQIQRIDRAIKATRNRQNENRDHAIYTLGGIVAQAGLFEIDRKKLLAILQHIKLALEIEVLDYDWLILMAKILGKRDDMIVELEDAEPAPSAPAVARIGKLEVKFRVGIPPELTGELKRLGLKFDGGRKAWLGNADDAAVRRLIEKTGQIEKLVRIGPAAA